MIVELKSFLLILSFLLKVGFYIHSHVVLFQCATKGNVLWQNFKVLPFLVVGSYQLEALDIAIKQHTIAFLETEFESLHLSLLFFWSQLWFWLSDM